MRCSEDSYRVIPTVCFLSIMHEVSDLKFLLSVDTDRDGWVQINYEQFMSVSYRLTRVPNICS
jgi:hypothetical protein